MSRNTIVTRSMSRKRKRSTNPVAGDHDNDGNDNSNHNSNEPPAKKQKAPSNNNDNSNTNPLQVIQLAAYHCCVCKELTADKIFQCLNGHLICNECYLQLEPCKCPTCRIKMDKLNPIRNRMAEDTLSFRVAECRYDGCHQKSIFSKLKIHQSNECLYKPTICKFVTLGCGWKGLKKNKSLHEQNCRLDQDKLLDQFRSYSVYKRFFSQSSELHRQRLFLPYSPLSESYLRALNIYFYERRISVVIKVSAKQINDEQVMQFYAQISLTDAEDMFDEDVEDDYAEEVQVNIGGVVEIVNDDADNCYVGNFEIDTTFKREKRKSEWLKFGKQFARQQYMSLFHPDERLAGFPKCALEIVICHFD